MWDTAIMSEKQKTIESMNDFNNAFGDLLGEHYSVHGTESVVLSFDNFLKRFRKFLLPRYKSVNIKFLYQGHKFYAMYITDNELNEDMETLGNSQKLFAPPIPCLYFGGQLANNMTLIQSINNAFCHSVVRKKYKYMLTVEDIYHTTSWRDGGLKIKFTINNCE